MICMIPHQFRVGSSATHRLQCPGWIVSIDHDNLTQHFSVSGKRASRFSYYEVDFVRTSSTLRTIFFSGIQSQSRKQKHDLAVTTCHDLALGLDNMLCRLHLLGIEPSATSCSTSQGFTGAQFKRYPDFCNSFDWLPCKCRLLCLNLPGHPRFKWHRTEFAVHTFNALAWPCRY